MTGSTSYSRALAAYLDGRDPEGLPGVRVVQHRCAVVLAGDSWACIPLAVLESGTDAVLEMAAVQRAQAVVDAAAESARTEGPEPKGDPAPEVVARVVEAGGHGRVLVWIIDRGGVAGMEMANELLDAPGADVSKLRADLPASTPPAVEALPPVLQEVYRQAACAEGWEPGRPVDMAHLAAALLEQPMMWPGAPRHASWPDLTAQALTVLREAARDGQPIQALQIGLVHWLREADGHSPPAWPTEPVGWHAAGVEEVVGDDRHADNPKAVDLAAHLTRRDTPVVGLYGPDLACQALLAGVAVIAARTLSSRLTGRRVVRVDPAEMSAVDLRRLLDLLPRHAHELVLVIRVGGSLPLPPAGLMRADLGADLVAAAEQMGTPVVLLVVGAGRPANFGENIPVVVAGSDRVGLGPTLDALERIAAGMAAVHRVTISPAAIRAAGAPAPVVRPGGKQAVDELVDSTTGLSDPDELALSRLEFACARASLRTDRVVTAADVPADPTAGIAAGPAVRPVPSAQALQESLESEVVGQPAGVRRIAARLAIGAAGVRTRDHGPVAAILLAGPPGTGKTHTAQTLAEVLHGGPDALIRIDCGGLYDRHTVSTLLGAPPGYAGGETSPRWLTTRIGQHPSGCLVLIDEVEKAAPSILDVFLAALDRGTLTDLRGRAVDTSGCVFLFTSNLGSEHVSAAPTGFTAADPDDAGRAVRAEISRQLRPELLDRLDDIVVYQPLGVDSLTVLAGRQLDRLVARARSGGYVLRVAPGLDRHLASHALARGARELHRHIDTVLVGPLLSRPPGAYVAVPAEYGKVAWRFDCTAPTGERPSEP